MSTLTKRLSWALAISIGLNLFLVGYGSSRWLRVRGPHEKPAAHGPGHGPGPALSRVLGPPTPVVREQHRALMDARRDVGDALRAEPYDNARLVRALDALRATTAKSQEVLHQRLLEQAPTLTKAERGELARSRFLRGGQGEEPAPH